MYYTSALLRWFQRKRYQYEYHPSLLSLLSTLLPLAPPPFPYLTMLILTTDSVLFLILSMIIIAASLYLPEHIATIANRAWFYYAGDEGSGNIPAATKAMNEMGAVGTGTGVVGEIGEGLR
ncbi:MAG: hypothetical protein M1835_001352 [Candelina submexicana]|nr:MAG: hypothetical protein M1835_001352 [Candelina submexicana]